MKQRGIDLSNRPVPTECWERGGNAIADVGSAQPALGKKDSLWILGESTPGKSFYPEMMHKSADDYTPEEIEAMTMEIRERTSASDSSVSNFDINLSNTHGLDIPNDEESWNAMGESMC